MKYALLLQLKRSFPPPLSLSLPLSPTPRSEAHVLVIQRDLRAAYREADSGAVALPIARKEHGALAAVRPSHDAERLARCGGRYHVSSSSWSIFSFFPAASPVVIRTVAQNSSLTAMIVPFCL